MFHNSPRSRMMKPEKILASDVSMIHIRCANTQENLMANALPVAVRITIPFSPPVYDGLKRAAERDHRELTELIQRVLAEHLMSRGLLEKAEEERIRLMWKLVDQAVAAAQKICREGGFSAAITLNA